MARTSRYSLLLRRCRPSPYCSLPSSVRCRPRGNDGPSGECGVIVAAGAVKIEAVNTVSTLRKLGVAARIAREHAGRNRTVRALTGAARTTLRSVGRAMTQLWLEVMGTLFLVMAAFGGMALIREYMKYTSGHATAGRVAVATCFTLAFSWFALSSFWRAQRKGRS